MRRRERYITWRECIERGFGLMVALGIVVVAWAFCWFAQAARVPGSWQYNLTMALRGVLG